MTNDHAVTFPNLVSSSPGVLVEEESDATFFFLEEEEAFVCKLIINLSWQHCHSLAVNVGCCVHVEVGQCSMLGDGHKKRNVNDLGLYKNIYTPEYRDIMLCDTVSIYNS